MAAKRPYLQRLAAENLFLPDYPLLFGKTVYWDDKVDFVALEAAFSHAECLHNVMCSLFSSLEAELKFALESLASIELRGDNKGFDVIETVGNVMGKLARMEMRQSKGSIRGQTFDTRSITDMSITDGFATPCTTQADDTPINNNDSDHPVSIPPVLAPPGDFQRFAAAVAMVQSTAGNQGDYEVVVGRPLELGGGLLHFTRENDKPHMPWSQATIFGTSLEVEVGYISMVTTGDGQNLDIVCLAGETIQHFHRHRRHGFIWKGPFAILDGHQDCGPPALSKSDLGGTELLKLVVPIHGIPRLGERIDGLLYVTKPALGPPGTWTPRVCEGKLQPCLSTETAIAFTHHDCSFTTHEDHELRAVSVWRKKLYLWSWKITSKGHLQELKSLGFIHASDVVSQVIGRPVILRNISHSMGGCYEVFVASAKGGITHLRIPPFRHTWILVQHFAKNLGIISDLTVIQGNYGIPGNLELICIAGGKMYFCWGELDPLKWHEHTLVSRPGPSY